MNAPTKETLFHRSYWRAAVADLYSTRNLVFAALMVAMARVLALIPSIPIAHTKLSFSFPARAMCALVCGPVAGMAYGFVEDILSFILQPTGEFFFGYTISTMAGMLVYALCFYRRRVTVARIVVSNVLVNIFVNAMMGSLWTMMIRGGGYWGWFSVSLSKNLLTIVPKSVLLYFFFQALLPVLGRVGVLGKEGNDLIRAW
ncbi:MAG: folate family ECF transporter S component [Ruminococcaceae bacterium]|nr:folate family ECF transporter S component [Oscillospiraceae bacterium]